MEEDKPDGDPRLVTTALCRPRTAGIAARARCVHRLPKGPQDRLDTAPSPTVSIEVFFIGDGERAEAPLPMDGRARTAMSSR
jgi:hypothetical protein